MSSRARGHARLSAACRHLVVMLVAAASTTCGGEEPSSVWDDLRGTIYFTAGTYQDSVRQVDPRTGVITAVAGAPTASYLAAAPDGSWLLITRRAVLRFDVQSSRTSIIAPDVDESSAAEGDVSPDGVRVAYLRTDRDGDAIVVRNADGTGARVVYGPTSTGSPVYPTWIDDEHITFLEIAGRRDRLWTVSADGTGLGFFASDTGLIVDLVRPAPQIGRLLVVRRPTGTLPDELWEMDYGGRLVRRLTTESGGLYPFFAWSPDGKYIAYCVATPTSDADLILLHVGSGETKALTTDPGFECQPAWAP